VAKQDLDPVDARDLKHRVFDFSGAGGAVHAGDNPAIAGILWGELRLFAILAAIAAGSLFAGRRELQPGKLSGILFLSDVEVGTGDSG
jgi:hypothetical protein